VKIVVISDVHANLDALMALPESGDELWMLGDLVDYGPSPREVCPSFDLARMSSSEVAHKS